VSGYPIRTARLTVRLMRSSDVDTLCAYRDETEVAAMQDWAMPYVAGMAGWLSGQDRLDDIASGGRTHLAIDLGGEQRRGIGRQALRLLARRLLAEGNTHMTTTFAEGRGGPREFYLGLGGRLTGEIVDDETEAVIDLTTLAAEPVEP
jgi:hypothetical protein